MTAGIEELEARIAELERQVAILFRQTGSTDWEAEAAKAPPVSAAEQALLAEGKERKAAKLYQEETGASVGEALAALGQFSRAMREP